MRAGVIFVTSPAPRGELGSACAVQAVDVGVIWNLDLPNCFSVSLCELQA